MSIMKVILNYLRYSQMVPMIICWAMFLFVFFLSLIFVVISSRPEMLTDSINYIIRIFNIQELHINRVFGTDDILWAYGIISMVVYALVSLIQLIFHVKFSFNFKQKLIYLLGLTGGMSILMFICISFAYFVSQDQIYAGYFIFIPILFIATIVASIYYLLVSQAMNYIIKVIDYILAHNS